MKADIDSFGNMTISVAFRFLSQTSPSVAEWTRWLDIRELQHYGPDGNLIDGPHPDWKVEYAYSGSPTAPGASHE